MFNDDRFKIKDSQLLSGVIALENDLKNSFHFMSIEFIEWREMEKGNILSLKLSENGKYGLITFENKHAYNFYLYPNSADITMSNSDEMNRFYREIREELLEETIFKLKNVSWEKS